MRLVSIDVNGKTKVENSDVFINGFDKEILELNELLVNITGFTQSLIISEVEGDFVVHSKIGAKKIDISLLIKDILSLENSKCGTLQRENHKFISDQGIGIVVFDSFEFRGAKYYIISLDEKNKLVDESKVKALSYCKRLLIKTLENYFLEQSRGEEIKQIKENLEFQQEVYNDIAIGTWVYSIEEENVDWSSEIFEILDITPEQHLTFDQFLIDCISDNRVDIKRAVNEALEKGETFDVVFRLINTTKRKWIRCKGGIIHNRQNKRFLMGSMQDITAIQDRNLKYEGIFNSTYTFIGFLDVNGVLLEANDTALRLAGIERKDVIGKKFWDCYWWQVSEDSQNTLKENFNKVLTSGKEVSYDVKVWIKDHKEITILFSLKPVKDARGNILYVVPEGRPIQDLIDSRKRYKNVIRAGQIGVWEWNMKTGQAMYNEEWKNILNTDLHTIDHPTIDDWYNLVHKNDLQTVKALVEENLVQKKQRFTTEFRMRTKNGNHVWVEATMNVHNTHGGGHPELVYGNARDITKRRIVEDELIISENAFRSNFENAAIGMALINETGGWLKVNNQITSILGYSKDELSKLTFQEITHPDDLENDLELLKEVVKGDRGHYQMEKRYFHKDGSVIYAILGVSVVRNNDGGIRYFISQIIDITTLKETQRKLEQQNDHLEQFAHVAAHDLQQPLRTVTNYLSLYKKKYAEKLDEKEVFFIENAINGALKMKELINGILDFSKTTVLNKEMIDLSKLVRNLSNSLIDSTDKEVEINVGRLPLFFADRLTMHQLFSNLIENAIKYQPEGNTPIVDISANEEDSFYILSIADNGIGIREDQYRKVFNLFQRLHSNDRFQGNGIGLATCKRIVNTYEGDIWLEPNVPQGLKVMIKLPKKFTDEEVENITC